MGCFLEIKGEGDRTLVLELPDMSSHSSPEVLKKIILAQIHRFREEHGILGEVVIMDTCLGKLRSVNLEDLCKHATNNNLQWLEKDQKGTTSSESEHDVEIQDVYQENVSVEEIVIEKFLSKQEAEALARQVCIRYWARIGEKENDFENCKKYMSNTRARPCTNKEKFIMALCKDKVSRECSFIAQFAQNCTGQCLMEHLTHNHRHNHNASSGVEMAAKSWYTEFGQKFASIPEDLMIQFYDSEKVRNYIEDLLPDWYKTDRYDAIECLKKGSEDNQISVRICAHNEEIRALDEQNKGFSGLEKGKMAKEIWAEAERKSEEIKMEAKKLKEVILKLEKENVRLLEENDQYAQKIRELEAENASYRENESKRKQARNTRGPRQSQAREPNPYKPVYLNYRR